jgi:DNA-binding transcriptional LysR family regulator
LRAKVILDDVAAATAAVRRIAHGDAGTVQLGITPPVAPVLAPHLLAALQDQAPDVELVVRRMWLPDLVWAVAEGTVDVSITCALEPDPPGVVGEVFGGEPLLVVLRETDRLAHQDSVKLADLARSRLGIPSDGLFPAWAGLWRNAKPSKVPPYRPRWPNSPPAICPRLHGRPSPSLTGSLRPSRSPALPRAPSYAQSHR